MDLAARAPRRVRHETRRRQLEVRQVDKIAAHMIRVALGGDLDGFTSLGFDDHVKLFFPDESAGPRAEPQTIARDYTPRLYDTKRNVLEIDFAIHDAGPATRWAEQARVGDALTIGGPRGSFIIPTNYDWHLLIGDETALPAIGRRLRELPAGTRAIVLAEVDGPEDELTFQTDADAEIIWAHRRGTPAGSSDVLARTLKTMQLPAGDYYAWVACESLIAKALRVQLLAEHGANKKWMRAAGYWRRGAVAVHDTHED
ncbi:MAG: siderophore-interacting protein [Xanthobacteraceae bacterium]|nr:siderophore-interacting protein [Xanthobacteraceae bacterium]